jgi:hypothetical protein
MKRTFAIRLQRYAEKLDKITAAIKRTEDLDEDYSPSAYTPSRNESLEKLEETGKIIKGYCLAVDDVFDRDNGITEKLFYQAIEQGKHKIEKFEYPDNDSGYAPAIYDEKLLETVDNFEKALF